MNRPYYITWTAQREAATMDLVSAKDATMYLADNHQILDFVSTSFQAVFGHSNAPIREAILQQLAAFPVASPKAVGNWKDNVSRRLLNYLQLPDGTLFYTVSGAEAVENALKMARLVTGRSLVLARRQSYHGATLGALSVTGDWRSDQPVNMADKTVRIPEPDEDPDLRLTREIIEKTGPEHIAAACLETITAMNGVVIPARDWWRQLAQLLKEYDILLITDEVSCGFGRTGPAFAFQSYDLSPDFVCMAKAITGGYIPFGALWTHPRIADFFQDRVLPCGLTSYGHPLGLAALGAVLDQLESEPFTQAKVQLEELFSQHLLEVRQWPEVAAVRNRGLLAAIDLVPPRRLTWAAGFAAGLHLAVKESMIVLAPPYIMSEAELADGFRRLRSAITAVP